MVAMDSNREVPPSLNLFVQDLLTRRDWVVSRQPSLPTDVRERLLAHHTKGPDLLAVARPSASRRLDGYYEQVWRPRNNRYFARLDSRSPWLRVGTYSAVTAFMDTLTIDPQQMRGYGGASPLAPPNPRKIDLCSCGKEKFSEEGATEALIAAKLKRALRSNMRRQERRSYQCDDDVRVWHLTSSD